MKIKIEPNILRQRIDSAMISKGNKPIIDPAIFIFEPDKVKTFGIFSGNIGNYQELKKNFFLDYECKEKEIIPFSDAINSKLKWGFSTTEMTVATEKDKIKFTSPKDTFETTLENYEPPKMPWKFVMTEDMKGFVPVFNYNEDAEWDKKTINIDSVFDVDKSELKLPPTDEYELIFDKSGLIVRIPEGGSFSRQVSVKVIKDKSIRVKADTEMFTSIVNNLEDGLVRIAITERMILFVEDRKDHNSTWFMATQIE